MTTSTIHSTTPCRGGLMLVGPPLRLKIDVSMISPWRLVCSVLYGRRANYKAHGLLRRVEAFDGRFKFISLNHATTVDTLLTFSPIGIGLSSWYGQGGIRFTSATSGIRPYAETSAGYAKLHTEVASFGSGNVSLLTNAALRFLDRTYPMATVGGGVTLEGGRFVADVGYRCRRIFSNDWVTLLSLGQQLNVSEVRVGVGLRF